MAETSPPPALAFSIRPLEVVGVALVVAVAFLIASFPARNSDLWLNLATGRLVAQGAYPFGSDPFRYTAEGSRWVEHAWLTDTAAYYTFQILGGSALVALKAFLVALTAAILLIGCRSAQFPGFLLLALALLASAPRLGLQPLIVSLLAVALLMLLLLVPFARTWLRAGAIGLVMALWVNADSWYVIGLLVVFLFAAGELISWATGRGDPAWPPASVASVVVASILGCLASPYHIHGLTLPPELSPGLVASLSTAPLFREIALSPLDPGFFHPNRYGNLNGLAFLVLIVVGPLAFGLNAARLRVSHLLVWLGLALLSLAQMRAIPFFALVSVPLVAQALGGVVERANPRPIFRRTGNGLVLALLAVMAIAVWPGWLQPGAGHPQFGRPVGWYVVTDPSLKQVAERLQEWRRLKRLPAEARGFHAHPDLGAYCAWFAPAEPVFIDPRPGLPGSAVREFGVMRQALRQVDAEPLQHSPAQAILDERSIRYLVLSDPPGLDDARQQILAMWSAADWELWYLDGRTAIYGRSGSAPLRLDPVAMAFAPAPSAKTAGPITPPPPSLRAAPRDDDWWAMLTSPPRRTPLATSEALLWSILGEIHQSRASQERALLADVAGRLATPRDPLGQLVFAVVGSTATARALAAADPLTSQDGLNAALPILALRAAREAIRENPQDPEAFAILAETYLALPTAPDTRQVVTLAALRSYAKRLPRGDSLRAQPHLANFPMLARLAQTHFQAGHFDLGVEAAEQALEHLEVRAPPTMPPEQVEQLRQGQREQLRQLKEELRRREDRYQLVRSTNEPGVSYRQADALGLTRKMVDSLQMSDEFFPPEGDPFMSMQRALRVQILTGDVEPAQQSFRDGYVSGPAPQPMRHLQVLASLASGDLDQTIEVFDTLRQNDNLMRPDEIVADLGKAAAPPLAWVALDRVWVSQKQIATNLDYLVRRGLVCIEAGRTIEARRSLLDALNTPTPGVEDARALARYYLRFLEQERQRATASRR